MHGHLVPGIDITDDPLLAGRLFSYLGTQITRLAGPNFSQIPINRPHSPVNDMLRDGFHQDAVHRGVAPYRPNSLDGGCPFLAGADTGAYIETPVRVPEATKVRQASESFSDHFSQPRRFWLSMSAVEREHIIAAYTFELGKCYEQAIKERGLQVLANIDAELCAGVAEGLGLPAPEPTVPLAEVEPSPALSQVGPSWPTDGRLIGIVTGPDGDLDGVRAVREAVLGAGMVPLVIAPTGGKLGEGDDAVTVQRTFVTAVHRVRRPAGGRGTRRRQRRLRLPRRQGTARRCARDGRSEGEPPAVGGVPPRQVDRRLGGRRRGAGSGRDPCRRAGRRGRAERHLGAGAVAGADVRASCVGPVHHDRLKRHAPSVRPGNGLAALATGRPPWQRAVRPGGRGCCPTVGGQQPHGGRAAASRRAVSGFTLWTRRAGSGDGS